MHVHAEDYWQSEHSHSKIEIRDIYSIYLVRANHTEHVQQRLSPWMAMTFDGQNSSYKTRQCAKEEVSSSLLGKLAPPCFYMLQT